MTAIQIISIALGAAGMVFMLASVTGIVRFPDFFTKLQAQGIGDTIGAFLVMAAMMAAAGTGPIILKIILIFIIISITNPVGTNLIMIAAVHRHDYQNYRSKFAGEVRDECDPGQISGENQDTP